MRKNIANHFTILITCLLFIIACKNPSAVDSLSNKNLYGEEIYCTVNELSGILDVLDKSIVYKIHIKDENPNFKKMRRVFFNHDEIEVHLFLDLCTIPLGLPDSAFESCSTLQSVKLPEQIQYVGDYCFTDCKNLKECILPENLVELGYFAFYRCYALESIELPDSLEKIGDSCFEDCENLISISIPEKIIQIPESCFSYCDKLEECELSSSLLGIGAEAFYYCKALKSINLPATLEKMGKKSFYACKNILSVSIPERIKTIPNYCFYSCEKLKDIVFKDGLESIESDAFAFCYELNNINLPDSLKYLKQNVFMGCTNLSEIHLSLGLEEMYGDVYERCSSLKNVIFPEGVKIIGPLNISKTLVEEFIVPASVEALDEGCFSGCEKLKTVTFNEAINQSTILPESCFYKCISLNNFTLPPKIKKIGDNCFSDSQLKSIDLSLSEDIKVIGNYAFYNCDFENFIIPGSVVKIGKGAFWGNNKLVEMTYEGSYLQWKDSIVTNCRANGVITFAPESLNLVHCNDSDVNIILADDEVIYEEEDDDDDLYL